MEKYNAEEKQKKTYSFKWYQHPPLCNLSKEYLQDISSGQINKVPESRNSFQERLKRKYKSYQIFSSFPIRERDDQNVYKMKPKKT